MSQPPPYAPSHSFVADSATLANFPGQALDVEFANIAITTAAVEADLALIQRDDGALVNGVVTFDSLSPSLQTAGIAPASAWMTGTTYVVGVPVVVAGSLYRSLVLHISGVFATDLAAGKWLLVSSLTTAFTAGANLTLVANVFAVQTSPSFTTPNINVATATSVNGLALTPSTGTLTIANAKVVTVNNTLTLAGTDGTTQTFPATSGNVLTSVTGASGDLTGTYPAPTVAANAITNAKMATMPAWTFKGNATSGAAVPTDVTIDGLTLKASPATTDELIIWDVAGSAWKKAVLSGVTAVGAVTSIAGNVGAFTLGAGLKNSTNILLADPVYHRGYLGGLGLSAAGSTATYGIAAGVATDSTTTSIMKFASAYTKTTASWALGTGVGSLDTGVIANSTWYHVYVIQRPDTGVVDILCSLSTTSPTLPTNYTLFRRIGSMKTDGAAQWTKFYQHGDRFEWDVPTIDLNSTTVSATPATQTLNVPAINDTVIALVNGVASHATLTPGVFVYSTQLSATPSGNAPTVKVLGSAPVAYAIQVVADASGNVEFVSSNTATTLTIGTYGWLDRRGRDA